MSDMGLAGELALTDKAIALITKALKELQTSESVFLVFFYNKSLRLAEVLDDVADGLGREELGILALVAAGEGVHQRRTTLDPLREVVGGHVRVAVGEIQLSQFALGVTLDCHNSLVFSA